MVDICNTVGVISSHRNISQSSISVETIPVNIKRVNKRRNTKRSYRASYNWKPSKCVKEKLERVNPRVQKVPRPLNNL